MNSIYRQAPYIKPEDHSDFINYAKCWAEVLDAHHTMEETSLFPQIEAKTGEVGIMEENVEQHHAFLPGLSAYKQYLTTCSTKPETSGYQLVSIIDSFAPTLFTHLTDEIPTLLALSKFGSKPPLLDMINAESQKPPLHQFITGGTPFFFRNLDLNFEDGCGKSGRRFWAQCGGSCRGRLWRGILGGGGLLVVMRMRGWGTCLRWRIKGSVGRA
ncbi:uncharacterized protein PAC_11958 [Phialocephala subalpina]|uniref:Hemerythrin-like domain-containing protein n=1 Tax=Phialocephala subalpina TaxID=576137 RepID=A0A1L7XAL0_9HELO|nr:uncharacterized protein PAC_11958 [Phialocephala subalpina]